MPLKPPDSLHLRSAEGWLELGDPAEASQEIAKIRANLRLHPDVLEVCWQICVRTRTWDCSLTVARSLIERAPDRPNGWINLSFALHELNRTPEAWDNLFKVAEKFPGEPTIAYNLACYGAQLGRLWEAEQWLKQAFKVGDATLLKRLALSDADLKPLWKLIGNW